MYGTFYNEFRYLGQFVVLFVLCRCVYQSWMSNERLFNLCVAKKFEILHACDCLPKVSQKEAASYRTENFITSHREMVMATDILRRNV